MKSIKQLINEKLKVSTNTQHDITFGELYDLIYKYTKKTRAFALSLTKLYGHKITNYPLINLDGNEYHMYRINISMNGGVKNIIPEYFKPNGSTTIKYIKMHDTAPIDFLREDDLNKIIEYLQYEIHK